MSALPVVDPPPVDPPAADPPPVDPPAVDPAGVDPVGAASSCPACGEPYVPGDRFCESCGTTLAGGGPPAEADANEPATASAAASGPAACPCGDGVADPDGYCSSCGRLVPAPADHTESDLGPVGALVSDRGLRHSRNEDFGWLEQTDRGAIVAVVADGVSSSHDPQKASAAAAQAAGAVLAAAAEVTDAVVTAALDAAGAAVATITDAGLLDGDGRPRPGASVPACTLVAAHLDSARPDAADPDTVDPNAADPDAADPDPVDPDAADLDTAHPHATTEVTVVSVGDSRAYWIPDHGPAAALSVDDSWATEQISRGADPDVAFADPRAHQITAWIGMDAGPLVPHVVRRRLDGPGVLMLCSDGLWNYVPALSAIAELVRAHVADADRSPLAAARSLTEFARRCGGHDNITVALIAVPDHARGAAR